MGERIDLPQTPQGTAEEQLRQMYSYLYRVAEALNHNLSEIGSMDLTDDERSIMQQITAEEEGAEAAAYDWQGKESLKSLIIKTAAFVQNKLDAYRMNLLGEYVTEGKFGKYVRNTSLKVDVTPSGIQQDFTFEEVVQGLKNYTVNAKNYIKTGLLRTVGGLPVYGVAIGKDVVTFSQDGTETYNDGNKVAELTADELSFYQNGNKVASYTGNRISFYSGNNEVMFIQNGKIFCAGELEITAGNKIVFKAGTTAKWEYNQNGMTYTKTGDPLPFQIMNYDDRDYLTNGVFYHFSDTEQTGEVILLAECRNGEHTSPSGFWRGEAALAMTDNTGDLDSDNYHVIFYPRAATGTLGTRTHPWRFLFCRNVIGNYDSQTGQGVISLVPNPYIEKRQKAILLLHSVYTESETQKDQINMIASSSLDRFVIQGNAAENQIIGFSILSGVKQITGSDGIVLIRPDPAAGKQNARLRIREFTDNGVEKLQIYKESGADVLEFYGNLYGPVEGNVTGNVTGNLTGNVTGKYITGTDGTIVIRPDPATGKSTARLIIREITDSGQEKVQLYKDSGADVLEIYGKHIGPVEGNVTGNVTGNLTGNVTGKVNNSSTTETDMNKIKDTGSYWLAMSVMTNKPSTITSGSALLEVNKGSDTAIYQKLSTGSSIYSRMYLTNAWTNWYRYPGTAV